MGVWMGALKGTGIAWLLSAVANVNWPFGQNRTGYRLHFNFPLLPGGLPESLDAAAEEIGKLSGIDLVFLFTLKAVCIHLKG